MSRKKPTPEMLKGVDVMVYDIQDVGTRSYTFISTLGLVMRACAEQDIEVMVLDRPNPLGGLKVEGCLVEPGFFSFVSEFRIPYVYGLTVGISGSPALGMMMTIGTISPLAMSSSTTSFMWPVVAQSL